MISSYEGKWIEHGISAEEIVDTLLIFDEHSKCHWLLCNLIQTGVRFKSSRWSHIISWVSRDTRIPKWRIILTVKLGLLLSCIEPIDVSFLNALEGVHGNPRPLWRRRVDVKYITRISVKKIMDSKQQASLNLWNNF